LGRRIPAAGHDGYRPPRAGNSLCAFVIRDNLRHRRDIEDAYLSAIETAQEEILIANAYFLPGLRFRHALMEAARRGVRVTVLVQGRVEYLLQHFATRALYAKLLAAGIRIHEYQRSFLHAKVAVIDGRWATVGSSNIDPFSLLLAREANLITVDEAFAIALRSSVEKAIKDGANAVAPDALDHQSWWQRLGGSIAYFLVRMAVGMTHYGGVDYRE
jgi:cardiolipin synthase